MQKVIMWYIFRKCIYLTQFQVMTLLGSNLKELVLENKNFSLKTTLMVFE